MKMIAVPVVSALGSWLWLWLATLSGAMLMSGVSFASERVWCHEVQVGDTLSSISRRYGVPPAKLRKVNAIRLTQPLRVGMRLVLPSIQPRAASSARGRVRALRARPGHLRRENVAASRDHLTRLRDLEMVRQFTRSGRLVPVAADAPTYYVAGVPVALRVARPWTRQFIEHLAGTLHALFGTRLRITSLVRTPARQLALRRLNTNAAPAHGSVRSTHLTGAAVDISKRPLAAREIDWLRTVLRRLTAERMVHAIEEFNEPHFHVLVRKRYRTYAAGFRSPMFLGGC